MNGTLGLLTLGLAAAFFVLAFLAYRRGRCALSLGCITAGGLLLRLFAGADLFLHPWDERYHALVAKNLIGHPLVPTLYDHPLLPTVGRGWGGSHIWLHKQPFSLWLMALSMAAFGRNEIALRLPSLVLSSAALLCTYGIGRRLGGERAGLLAAFLQAIHAGIISLAAGQTATDHVDTVFVALVGLGGWLALSAQGSRRWFWPLLIGGVTGLALLTKWLSGLLILIVWAVALSGRAPLRVIIPRLVLALLAAGVVFLPWQIYTHGAFPREAAYEVHYNLRHLYEPLEGHAGSILYYLLRIPRFFGELVYIPILWFLVRAVRPRLERDALALGTWLLIPAVIFSLTATKMPAYILIAAPAIFVMEGTGIVWLLDSARRSRGRPLAVILAGLLLALPVRICAWEMGQTALRDRRPAWAEQMRALGRDTLDRHSVVFGAERPIELMFYTAATAYPELPTPGQVTQLTTQGYRVCVQDRVDLPAELREDARVRVVTGLAGADDQR